MDVQAVAGGRHQRQVGQEFPFRGAELAARPFDDDPGFQVHLFARIGERIVVIAEHRHGTLVDQVHDGRHRPFGIGAIADIIAEQHDTLRSVVACLRQTRAERLPVGVNIRE